MKAVAVISCIVEVLRPMAVARQSSLSTRYVAIEGSVAPFRDQGHGIPRGFGIGLSIVRDLVRLYDGGIRGFRVPHKVRFRGDASYMTRILVIEDNVDLAYRRHRACPADGCALVLKQYLDPSKLVFVVTG